MSKKFYLLFVALLVSLPIFSDGTQFTSSSTEGISISFTVYNESSKTAWVSPNAIDVTTEGTLTIPSEANGYTITGVYNAAFSNCNKLTTIVFPSTITSFSSNNISFNGCSADYVVDSDNEFFFSRNGALYKKVDAWYQLLLAGGSCTSFTVESDIASISTNAFKNSTKLESITIEESTSFLDCGYGGFNNCPLLSAAVYRGISNTIFRECTTLQEITLGSQIHELHDYEFYGCSNLETITIQGNIWTIGYHAFDGTAWFANAPVENGVKYLDNLAIAWDGTTQDVTFKNTTTCIAKSFFYKFGGASLGKIVLPTSITNIPDLMFSYECTIDELVIPANVNRISYKAFCEWNGQYAATINKLIIEDSNNTMLLENSYDNVSASFRKTNIGTVTIGRPLQIEVVSGTKQDYSHPFGDATINKAIITHDIDISDMFYNSKVKEVELPSDMSSIGDYAFYGCTTLNKVISKAPVPPTVSSTGFSSFNYTANLYIPYGYLNSYNSAEYWQNFNNISYYDVDICTMPSTNICTYSSTYDLDFTNVEGLTAYVISNFNAGEGTLTLTPATTVKAGEGLLLKGNAGEYVVPRTTTDATYTNYLVGVPTTTSISPTEGDYTNFVLANGTHGVNFYALSKTGNISAGKAYLKLPTADINQSNLSRGFVIDDNGTTSISTPIRNEYDDMLYDLQGRRVNKPSKGLYIMNGKKVIIK